MRNPLNLHSTKTLLFSIGIFTITLFLPVNGSWAADFCVSNATELQARLTDSQSNLQDDMIKITRGTYNGNFTFNSSEGHSITLLGGYNAGCTTRTVNPENTVLDAQNSGRVIYLHNTNGGSITVDGLAIRNGNGTYGAGLVARSDKIPAGDVGDIAVTNSLITGNITGEGNEHRGGGINIYSKANSGKSANINLTGNIITGNSANWFGGGVYIMTMSYPSGDSGTIIFSNNIVTGNTATVYDGGGADIHSAANEETNNCGDINFCNNTLTGNNAGRYGGGVALDSQNGTVRCYNNIIWGNSASTGGNDIELTSFGSPTWNGYNNDYSDMVGFSWTNSGNNIDQDPLFANPSPGNYHLKGNSPCINAGIYGRKTYIPATSTWFVYDYSFIPNDDYEGDSRNSDWIEVTTNNYYRYCDIGADEYTPGLLPFVPLLLLNN